MLTQGIFKIYLLKCLIAQIQGQLFEKYYTKRNNANNRWRTSTRELGANLPTNNWEELAFMDPLNKNFYIEHQDVEKRTQQEIDEFRKAQNISLVGTDIPRPIQTLDETNIPSYILGPMKNAGYGRPTAIQAQSWPIALKGRDMIGVAQTGSGKTLSYVLPALIHIMKMPKLERGDGPIALVLAPTRELAQQIQSVVSIFSKLLRIRHTCLYGGTSRHFQARDLFGGVEFVIATPGRLIDFLETGQTNVNRVTYLVLDEADRMLDMGFEPQIRKIIRMTRPDRQTLMWSATWPREIQKLAQEFLTNPIQLNVGSANLAANPNIKQFVEICHDYEKPAKLQNLLRDIWVDGPKRTIIFAGLKRTVDELVIMVNKYGYRAMGLHGDKSQWNRDQTLRDFRSGYINVLIASDVASRGLDVEDIKYVINYDFPDNTENYVHRIGRTARSTKTGISYTLFTPQDGHKAQDLIDILNEAHQNVPDRLLLLAAKAKPTTTRRWRQRYAGEDNKGWGYQRAVQRGLNARTYVHKYYRNGHHLWPTLATGHVRDEAYKDYEATRPDESQIIEIDSDPLDNDPKYKPNVLGLKSPKPRN
uniref:RNA helicase n=1 Tax=Cacopsylla melanoneura TaxID=428564 RepID=A0A8D8QXI6_9HEMI